MSDNFIIDTMRWSFSRLNSFNNCKYEWYKHYVECEEPMPSFFGEFGGFCHECIEKFAKGELDIFDITDYYTDNYVYEVITPAPYNKYKDLNISYYNKGLEYFESIDLQLDGYEILGVEKEIQFEIGGYPMIGFIDLLLRNEETGEIVIVDHKSSTIKIKKNGEVSKTDMPHFEEFKKQLYLYSIPILEEYGRVDKLRWNMFKDGNWIEIPFDEDEFKAAKEWALNTIKEIEQEKDWEPFDDVNGYYCRNLCSFRDRCKYKLEKQEEYYSGLDV